MKNSVYKKILITAVCLSVVASTIGTPVQVFAGTVTTKPLSQTDIGDSSASSEEKGAGVNAQSSEDASTGDDEISSENASTGEDQDLSGSASIEDAGTASASVSTEDDATASESVSTEDDGTVSKFVSIEDDATTSESKSTQKSEVAITEQDAEGTEETTEPVLADEKPHKTSGTPEADFLEDSLIYDGEDYKVTVEIDRDAKIPSNSFLQVSEIDSDSEDFQQYKESICSKLAEETAESESAEESEAVDEEEAVEEAGEAETEDDTAREEETEVDDEAASGLNLDELRLFDITIQASDHIQGDTDDNVNEINKTGDDRAQEKENSDSSDNADDSLHEVEPAAPVKVSISLPGQKPDNIKQYAVVHFKSKDEPELLNADFSSASDKDSLAEEHRQHEGKPSILRRMPEISDQSREEQTHTISFTADSFSVYAIVGFHNNVEKAAPTERVQVRNEGPSNVYSDQLASVFADIGKFQLNYAGASAAWTEDGQEYTHAGYGNFFSGYSHLDEVSQYEKRTAGNNGNSSGSYLDSKYNEGGTIYKAFFACELCGVNRDLTKYPVTLVYGGEDGQPSDSIEVYGDSFAYNTIFRNNSFEWTDITDFVKKNGYGWYYACNIPGAPSSDCSLDWKIIVVEENPSLHQRFVDVKFGSVGNTGDGYNVLELSGDGFYTKAEGNVTGQILYNISNSDLWNGESNLDRVGSMQVSTDREGKEFSDIIAENGLRTHKSPLRMLKSRNTVPISVKENFNSPTNKDKLTVRVGDVNYPLTGSDVELLDINEDNTKHNIRFANKAERVTTRFNAWPAWLAVNILGMAVDIDVSDLGVTISNDKDYGKDGGRNIQITGAALTVPEEKEEQTQSESYIEDGKLTVTVDSRYKIDENSISASFFKKEDTQEKTPLDAKWTVSGNRVIFDYGDGKKLVSQNYDRLKFTIDAQARSIDDLNEEPIENTAVLTGVPMNNNKATSDRLFRSASTGFTYDLSIDPEGGDYTGNKQVTGLNPAEAVLITAPKKKGYYFKGWKLLSKDNGGFDARIRGQYTDEEYTLSISDSEENLYPSGTFFMGLQDTKLTAVYEPVKLSAVNVDIANEKIDGGKKLLIHGTGKVVTDEEPSIQEKMSRLIQKVMPTAGTGADEKALEKTGNQSSIRNGHLSVMVDSRYRIDESGISAEFRSYGGKTSTENGKRQSHSLTADEWEVKGNQVIFNFGGSLDKDSANSGLIAHDEDTLQYSIPVVAKKDVSLQDSEVINIAQLQGESFDNGDTNKGVVSAKAETHVRYNLRIDVDGGVYTGQKEWTWDPASEHDSSDMMGIRSGQSIGLEKPEKEGYTFKGWEIIDGGFLAEAETDSFRMGIQDTILKAKFEKKEELEKTEEPKAEDSHHNSKTSHSSASQEERKPSSALNTQQKSQPGQAEVQVQQPNLAQQQVLEAGRESTSSKASVKGTGDQAMTSLWITTMAVSGILLLLYYVRRRRG